AEPAQVVPLEAPDIVPANPLRLLGIEQVQHASDLPILPCQMRLTHLGKIQVADRSPFVAAGPLALRHCLLGVVVCLLRPTRRLTGEPGGDSPANHQGQGYRGQQARYSRIAPAPTPRPLRAAGGPRLDRLTALPALQVLRQGFRTAVASFRLLTQALQADGL